MTDEKKPSSPESMSEVPPERKAEPEPRAKPEPATRRSRGSLRSKVRWAKRIVVIVGVILLVLLLLNWKYCRRGKGAGGLEAADGSQTTGMAAAMTTTDTRKARRRTCRLRVDDKGVSHQGRAVTIPGAVKACRGAARAELQVTGDATFGTVRKLRQALRAAGVTSVRR